MIKLIDADWQVKNAYFPVPKLMYPENDLQKLGYISDLVKGVTIYWYIGILRYHFADLIYRYA